MMVILPRTPLVHWHRAAQMYACTLQFLTNGAAGCVHSLIISFLKFSLFQKSIFQVIKGIKKGNAPFFSVR